MSNQYEFENAWDDDEEEASDGPAGLRKALKDAQKKLKLQEQQLSEQGKMIRSRTIKDALSAKGLNPKLAALIPSDVEPTEEAVTAWVDGFSDVFVMSPVSDNTPEGSDSPPSGQQSTLTPEELQAQGIIERANGVASAPFSASSQQAKIEGSQNLEELMQAIQGG